MSGGEWKRNKSFTVLTSGLEIWAALDSEFGTFLESFKTLQLDNAFEEW